MFELVVEKFFSSGFLYSSWVAMEKIHFAVGLSDTTCNVTEKCLKRKQLINISSKAFEEVLLRYGNYGKRME